jgi:hypothetical protein
MLINVNFLHVLINLYEIKMNKTLVGIACAGIMALGLSGCDKISESEKDPCPCSKTTQEQYSAYPIQKQSPVYFDSFKLMEKYPTVNIKIKKGDKYWEYAKLMGKFCKDIKKQVPINERVTYLEVLNEDYHCIKGLKTSKTTKIPYCSKDMYNYINKHWKIRK